jgi:hypothetical protein
VTLNSQSNPEQKEQCRRYHNTHLQIFRALATKIACTDINNRYVDQCNRSEYPEINPHNYSHLIFDKDAKNICWKKDSFFNKWCWENWISTCRRLKLDPYLSPWTKINSKWIKDLIFIHRTLKLPHENTKKAKR